MGRMRAHAATLAIAAIAALPPKSRAGVDVEKMSEQELTRYQSRVDRGRWAYEGFSAYELQRRSRHLRRARRTHPGKRV